MQNTRKKQNQNCDWSEELLINQCLDEIPASELSQLKQHLAECPHCRKLADTLTQMEQTLQQQLVGEPFPRPEIRTTLIRALKARANKNIFTQSWLFLKRLLEYRIPVYQAALSLGVVVVAMLVLNSSFFEKASTELPISYSPETVLSDSNMVNNTLQLIQQQPGGRNVREDSALTKFIVTTM